MCVVFDGFQCMSFFLFFVGCLPRVAGVFFHSLARVILLLAKVTTFYNKPHRHTYEYFGKGKKKMLR